MSPNGGGNSAAEDGGGDRLRRGRVSTLVSLSRSPLKELAKEEEEKR